LTYKQLFFLIFFPCLSWADTNLGTLNTVKNGFGHLNECSSRSDKPGCRDSSSHSLTDILDFATTNQCIASQTDFQASGLNVPDCPQGSDQIRGLDNTYPSVGTFALYTGKNNNFIFDLAQNYLAGNQVGKFNLVLPKTNISRLKSADPELLALLNSPQVNIIEVNTTPAVGKWMQDSFQFTSIDGKPALYQLEHFRENGKNMEDRLACELAKKCDIPYYIPPDMVDPNNQERSSLNSGGNLEVLPGGTFYTGIIKTPGYNLNNPNKKPIPFRTQFQEIQKKSLEDAGNKILELDTSFLAVGHVDEIFNIVKTNKPAPCNFAVLMASPNKAFELMDQTAEKMNQDQSESSYLKTLNELFISSAYAGIIIQEPSEKNRCGGKNSYQGLEVRGQKKLLSQKEAEEVYELNCMDGKQIENFVKSDQYQILKRENLEQESPPSISRIMQQNKSALVAELKASTSCQDPVVIEIPVFFRNGLSYTPDLVNGVVESPPNSPSKVYLPKTYFKTFDDYVEQTLAKQGVETNFVHDLGYHMNHGEVHCGSNTARVCK
jgi:hypothetical protein